MRIQEIRLYLVSIPFRAPFRHAASERACSGNAVVEALLEDGTRGWGEGVPREYVTGETSESVLRWFQSMEEGALRPDYDSMEDLVEGLRLFRPLRGRVAQTRVDSAARCALELALLDAGSRFFGSPLPRILGRKGGRRFRYSGIVSSGPPEEERISLLKMRLFGFRHVKIKVGGGGDDRARMGRARRLLGRRVELRLDANGVWSLPEALERIREAARLGVRSVEQPLEKEAFREMKELRRASPVPIMLDESLATMEDAVIAAEEGLCDLFNIRLSKCGGLLNSLALAGFAIERGLGYQLGCQVGESGILSAAGRRFLEIAPPPLYAEGSYDRFLLRGNLTAGHVGFGLGGRAHPLPGLGWGVEVRRKNVERWGELKFVLKL